MNFLHNFIQVSNISVNYLRGEEKRNFVIYLKKSIYQHLTAEQK